MQYDIRTDSRSDGAHGRRIALPRRYLTLALLGLVLIAIVGAVGLSQRSSTAGAAPTFQLAHPRYSTLVATVSAVGQIKPAQAVSLSFRGAGRVSEVLVSVGAHVGKGDPLARLDDRDLQLRIVQAEAALAEAQAGYRKLQAGASPQEIAAAQAQASQAGGQLHQIQGNVTASDLDAAQAQLQQAQARLAELEAGAKPADIATAEAQLQQAQAETAAQRDQLSATKTAAQQRMEIAANTLRNSQADYSRIYWANRQLEGRGELPQARIDQEAEALRAVENAQLALDQATLIYDQARQAEVNGVAAAEARVQVAQTNLEKIRAGGDASQVELARAQLATARANLDKLRGEQRSGALQSARSAYEYAQANLKQLQIGPPADDLAIAQARVQSAQAALDQAKLALADATLTAPFDGTVADIQLTVGEAPRPTDAQVVLIDRSRFYVDAVVDEMDVAHLEAGQPVTVTLDALPDIALPGRVDSIGDVASDQAGVTSFRIRVSIAASDPHVRAGMSANADIVVQRKEHALLVPRRAVLIKNGQRVVEVLADESLCTQPPERWPRDPQRSEREVQLGLSSGQFAEIVGGLDERSCIYVEGVSARMDPLSGLPPGIPSRNP